MEAILSSFAMAPRCRIWIAALLAVVVSCGGAERADKLDIAGRYTVWQAALTQQRMADGYAIMSPAFRTLHSLEEFEQLFGGIAEDFPTLPSRYEVRFEATDDGMLAYLYPFDDNWFEFRNGVELEWHKVASRWYLTGELKYFRN
jgi:hypothetical protein